MGSESNGTDFDGASGVGPDPWLARLWYLAVLTAPWSVELPVGPMGWRLAVPSEPLLLFTVLMAIRLHGVRDLGRRIAGAWVHPIAIAAVAGLGWTAVCTVVSSSPVVSAKVLAVRGLQAVVYMVLGFVVIQGAKEARRTALIGAVGLAPVAVWALVRSQTLEGWQATHASAMPFFYSRLELTVIAVFWVLAVVGWRGRPRSRWSRGPSLVLLASVLVLRGRSAVVGLAAGMAARLLARSRCRPVMVAVVIVLAVTMTGALAVDLVVWRDGDGDPLRPSTVLEPLWVPVSETGLARDPSVLERLNRWLCCLRMAADRPVAGFGPGTFEREYGRFQRDRDRTWWSTDKGILGDAHSEPLGRLAEEGVVGLALEIALLGALLWTGFAVAASGVGPEICSSAESWTGAVAGFAAAGLFVCLSDLPGTGPAIWVAAAVLIRLDLEVREGARDRE